jgi:hypothetical protein
MSDDAPATEPVRAARHKDPRRLALAIYGLIVSASAMAASAGLDAAFPVAGATFVTVLVYWLAERYAEVVGLRIRGRLHSVRQVLREGWPLVEASYAPLAVLLASVLLGASVGLAVDLALLVTTCLLVGLGWSAGRASGLTGTRLLLAAGFNGLLGMILVGLKLGLH